jgi:general secretion pathway protein G
VIPTVNIRPTSPRRAPASGRRASGFSLLEITIVIVLIGGILALVGAKVMGAKDNSNYKLARTQLETLAQKIESYESDVGSLPESLDDLATAPGNAPDWLGPYARAADFKDPFGTPIQYRVPGDDDAPFQLVSLGADKKPGGEGVDKDIVKP